jgi:hypothetical protein
VENGILELWNNGTTARTSRLLHKSTEPRNLPEPDKPFGAGQTCQRQVNLGDQNHIRRKIWNIIETPRLVGEGFQQSPMRTQIEIIQLALGPSWVEAQKPY